jgi:hypothetical protein
MACSTAKVRILPGEVENKVVSTDYESDDAEEAAIEAATEYCKKRSRNVAFINPDQKSQYTGKMDEGTRNTVKKASDAAIMVSGPVGVSSRSAGAAGVLGTAGIIGRQMVNDRDYRAEWRFKCI